ncbi:FRG domain-containing protein [Lactococcus lactis]|uniref:FRG domain-containing protein n=1 Tax=Lactococcus lactis TaxID=1358 RepID=UPI00205BE83E|nr:FRG domain-containing protein [Lactococcus lactis]UPS11453.1 hypothetical protein JRY11_002505 [Lactococcus lactis]
MKNKALEQIGDNRYIINSLTGFIEFISVMSQKKYTWFRGQTDKEWDLEPGLSRKKRSPVRKKDSNLIQYIRYQTTDFNSAIDEAMDKVNNDPHYLEIKHLNLNKLQFILLAQHYGMKTPVLDWTTNPDIALFFALDFKQIEGSSPIIYATNPKLTNWNSSVTIGGKVQYEILKADNEVISNYVDKELKDIEGKEKKVNPFVFPIALESTLDFSHRITFQSGKFTINGPKKPLEHVMFKDLTIIPYKSEETEYYSISAEINSNDKELVLQLKSYLEDFGYTKENVYRLGDKKSRLLDELFLEIQNKHNNYPEER